MVFEWVCVSSLIQNLRISSPEWFYSSHSRYRPPREDRSAVPSPLPARSLHSPWLMKRGCQNLAGPFCVVWLRQTTGLTPSWRGRPCLDSLEKTAKEIKQERLHFKIAQKTHILINTLNWLTCVLHIYIRVIQHHLLVLWLHNQVIFWKNQFPFAAPFMTLADRISQAWCETGAGS